MTRRTAGTAPARYSNDFEPSDAAIPLDSLLSTAEAAEMVGVSRHTISDMCLSGELGGVKRGRNLWYIGRAQVERLIRQRQGVER